MNAKVRRYEPLFLSPQMRLLPRSPTKPASSWKDKVNHEVTLTYNRIKNNESKCSLPENNDLQQIRSVNSAIADCGARSCSTQSNTETPIKPKLELYNYQTISTTLYKTDREKEIENYYSHRVQLLEEECNYLRKEFIGHCLRHHRRQFERLSLH